MKKLVLMLATLTFSVPSFALDENSTLQEIFKKGSGIEATVKNRIVIPRGQYGAGVCTDGSIWLRKSYRNAVSLEAGRTVTFFRLNDLKGDSQLITSDETIQALSNPSIGDGRVSLAELQEECRGHLILKIVKGQSL